MEDLTTAAAQAEATAAAEADAKAAAEAEAAAEAAAKAEAAAVPAVIVPRDRKVHIGVHRGAAGYEYIEFAQSFGPERVVVIDGQRFEHTADDNDGVWLYRAEAF